MKSLFKISLGACSVILLVGCQNTSKPNYQFMPNMYESVGYETYAESEAFNGVNQLQGQTAQLPAEGSVKRGFEPYEYENSTEGLALAKANLKSPLTEISEADAAKGKELYGIYCAICHGPRAKGDGELASRLAVAPPDLTQISARNGGVFPLRDVADSVYGYAGKHDLDLMPEFTALLDGPETVLTDAEGRAQPVPQRLAEMLVYLQSLQRP
jgi:mono/diheme cytochrome c family protein